MAYTSCLSQPVQHATKLGQPTASAQVEHVPGAADFDPFGRFQQQPRASASKLLAERLGGPGITKTPSNAEAQKAGDSHPTMIRICFRLFQVYMNLRTLVPVFKFPHCGDLSAL